MLKQFLRPLAEIAAGNRRIVFLRTLVSTCCATKSATFQRRVQTGGFGILRSGLAVVGKFVARGLGGLDETPDSEHLISECGVCDSTLPKKTAIIGLSLLEAKLFRVESRLSFIFVS